MCAIIINNMIDRPLLANRLRESYNYLRTCGVVHTISEFAETVGKSQGDISNALAARGRVMTIGLLERVADTYPEYLSREYLLKGIGDIKAIGKNKRPHYDAKASAGFMDGISEGKMSAEFRAMAVPLKSYDFSIDVAGNSMIPEIKDGDVLMCRKLLDRLNPPIGKICVLDTKEGWVVKIIESVNEETITLHSLNLAYQDYEIDHNSILGVAEVVGLVRSFI